MRDGCSTGSQASARNTGRRPRRHQRR